MACLFDVKSYCSDVELKRLNNRRGKYKPKIPKPTPPNINPYKQLAIYYSQLANFFNVPIPVTDCCYSISSFNIWFTILSDDNNLQTCLFPDIIKEAEVKGTENLDIDVRIKYYKALLSLLNNGYEPEEAVLCLMNGHLLKRNI